MRSISLADGCTVFDVFWFVLNCNCLVDDGTSDSALHGSGFDLKFDHKLQVQASYTYVVVVLLLLVYMCICSYLNVEYVVVMIIILFLFHYQYQLCVLSCEIVRACELL